MMTIPQWALERACAAIGRKVHHYYRMGEYNLLRQSIAAHAMVIAGHEKPPAGELAGALYWKTADGVMLELKPINRHDFLATDPNVEGIPTVYAVWPTPS